MFFRFYEARGRGGLLRADQDGIPGLIWCLTAIGNRARSRIAELNNHNGAVLIGSDSKDCDGGGGGPGVSKNEADETREKENTNSDDRVIKSRCTSGSGFLVHGGINAPNDRVRKG